MAPYPNDPPKQDPEPHETEEQSVANHAALMAGFSAILHAHQNAGASGKPPEHSILAPK